MRVFGGEQIAGLMTRFNFPEDMPLTHPLVTRVISQAQVKVEGFNFESRKNLLDYDDVLNKQREIVYTLRRSIIDGSENITDFVMEKVKDEIASIVGMYFSEAENHSESIIEDFVTILNFDDHSKKHLIDQLNQFKAQEEAEEFLLGLIKQIEEARQKQFGKENIENVLKMVILSAIDNFWMEHLTAMEDLRTGIGLRGYGQRDPLVEYKSEAFTMFERLLAAVDDAITHRAYKINIQVAPQEPLEQLEGHTHVHTNTPASEVSEENKKSKKQITNSVSNEASENGKKKLGRNDSCWCGSGKKYKKCCLK